MITRASMNRHGESDAMRRSGMRGITASSLRGPLYNMRIRNIYYREKEWGTLRGYYLTSICREEKNEAEIEDRFVGLG